MAKKDKVIKHPKLRLTLRIIIDCLLGLVVLSGLTVSISSIVAKYNGGVSNIFGYAPLSVQSESMTGIINKGDLIFVKLVTFDENEDPSIPFVPNESVVSFRYDIDKNGTKEIVTHQYVGYDDGGVKRRFEFVGTYNPSHVPLAHQYVYADDVVGIYQGSRMTGFGYVSDFLGSPWGFFIIVMIPIILFFGYALYKLIRVLLESKKEKQKVEAATAIEDMRESLRKEILAELEKKNKKEEEDK